MAPAPPIPDQAADPAPTRSLDLRGWRPAGLVLAACLLLGVEAVARTDWIWSNVERSSVGIMDVVEARVIAPAPPPRVLILGNSRGRDAVLPSVLEEEMGLPAGAVLNACVNEGGPFDTWHLYATHREKLKHAEVVVLCFDDFQMKNSERLPTERYERYATLPQRLRDFDGDARNGLVAGWFWRTLEARQAFGRTVVRNLVGRNNQPARVDTEGRIDWRFHEPEHGPEEAGSAAHAVRMYQIRVPEVLDGWRVEYLKRLVDLIEADDAEVFFYRPGWRQAFAEARDELDPDADEALRHLFESLTTDPARRILMDGAGTDDGLAETDFIDYGHATRSAADAMTRRLARFIQDAGPAASGGAGDGGQGRMPTAPHKD